MRTNQKLKQGNHVVYTKIQKIQIKSIREKESIISRVGSTKKNRNKKLLLEKLYIITEYIKKATTTTGVSQRTQSPGI